MQKATSKNTSINKVKVPQLFTKVGKKFGWNKGTVNLDIGGGKYDTATKYLKRKGITNLIYDPFNRSDEHNEEVLKQVKEEQVDTVTLSNVLNTIDCMFAMRRTLTLARRSLKKGGTLYITIYIAPKQGKSGKDGYQWGHPLIWYLVPILKVFEKKEIELTIKHQMIVIKT